MHKAILALEDGSVFEGQAFGARIERSGEVVFNTSITGYQEIFTDPSYSGQIVVLTYPQIGNYGANESDSESASPHIEGLIVRDFSPISSNWRAGESADQFLAKNDIPIGASIDTRKLVRHLRTRGVMRGVLSTLDGDPARLVEKARNIPSMAGLDLATKVSTKESYTWTNPVEKCSPSERLAHIHKLAEGEQPLHVVAYDYGIKRNILRRLVSSGCKVTVVPSLTAAEDVLALNPDGVFLSNGPGDPGSVKVTIQTVQELLGWKPIFGICMGNQILSLALGAKTYKLKFGHRGSNHPVRDLLTGSIYVTSQNHGYAVDEKSLPSSVRVSQINLNDQSLEGIECNSKKCFSVQYHPESHPGPHEARKLFDYFLEQLK